MGAPLQSRPRARASSNCSCNCSFCFDRIDQKIVLVFLQNTKNSLKHKKEFIMKIKNIFLTILSVVSALTMTSSLSSCASGGFKLTRDYARWVNSQNIIIRIILYIFTSFVFGITILIDAVIFNTMDFWEGRVSQGDYLFEKDGKNFLVKHSQNNDLKKTIIQISQNNNIIETLVIEQKENGNIDVLKNGQKIATAQDLNTLPKIVNHIDNTNHLFLGYDLTKLSKLSISQ